MTDWLEDVLDQHPGAPVPEGFAAAVLAQARAESARGRLLRFSSLAAAALLLLAVGFWLGNGADPFRTQVDMPGGASSASLEVEEIYANRELLEDLELLSDASLELAFQDASTGTWILDVPVPGEDNATVESPADPATEDEQ